MTNGRPERPAGTRGEPSQSERDRPPACEHFGTAACDELTALIDLGRTHGTNTDHNAEITAASPTTKANRRRAPTAAEPP